MSLQQQVVLMAMKKRLDEQEARIAALEARLAAREPTAPSLAEWAISTTPKKPKKVPNEVAT